MNLINKRSLYLAIKLLRFTSLVVILKVFFLYSYSLFKRLKRRSKYLVLGPDTS